MAPPRWLLAPLCALLFQMMLPSAFSQITVGVPPVSVTVPPTIFTPPISVSTPPVSVTLSKILGNVVCDKCLDGQNSATQDDPLVGVQVSVNCTINNSVTGTTFVTATGTTSTDGSFSIGLSASANAAFLTALYIGGVPTNGVLPGAALASCKLAVESTDCPIQILSNGLCLEAGMQGNGETSALSLVNLGATSADISIGGEICTAPLTKDISCPTVSSPPTSVGTPPVSVSTPPISISTPPISVSTPPISVSTPPVSVSTPPISIFTPPISVSTPPISVSTPPISVSTPPISVSTPPVSVSTPPISVSTPPISVSTPPISVSTPPVSVTVPGVTGDPHFTGADGSRFDFSGVPDSTYCLISDSHLHINVFYGGRFDRWGDNPHKALTWIRQMGVLWDHHTVTFAARSGARWQYDNGYMARMEIDGEEVTLGQEGDSCERAGGAIKVTWLAAKAQSADDLIDVYELEIRGVLKMRLNLRPEIALLRTEKDGLVHIDFDLPVTSLSSEAHGILGQTYRRDHRDRLSQQKLEFSELFHALVVPGDNAEGFIDGTMADYRSSGLLGADCRFSRFTGATARDVTATEALELTSTGGKNINGKTATMGRKMGRIQTLPVA